MSRTTRSHHESRHGLRYESLSNLLKGLSFRKCKVQSGINLSDKNNLETIRECRDSDLDGFREYVQLVTETTISRKPPSFEPAKKIEFRSNEKIVDYPSEHGVSSSVFVLGIPRYLFGSDPEKRDIMIPEVDSYKSLMFVHRTVDMSTGEDVCVCLYNPIDIRTNSNWFYRKFDSPLRYFGFTYGL